MLDPDSSLNARVDSAISRNPYLFGRRLNFHMDEGRVTLQGEVQTYFQKQMAQEALRKVNGVTSIDNRLEVTWGQASPQNVP